MLIDPFLRKGLEIAADQVVFDPLAADGKAINAEWEHAPDAGLQLILHRAELELAALREFLPRLGQCFDHGLEGSQIEILQHRLARLTVKKGFHGYYSVVQRGEVTNLEIMIEFQLRGTYLLVLRGMGPAMDVVRQELERFQPTAAPTPAVAAPLKLAGAAAIAPVRMVAPSAEEIPADGILRLAADRSAWRAQIPMEQGHVLGQPIRIMVENKRFGNDIQPQQADHQLLTQIFAQLPLIAQQVVKYLVEHVEDPVSLRSLGEPMIFLAAERVDPQAWSFSLQQNLPSPSKLTMSFRGVHLLR